MAKRRRRPASDAKAWHARFGTWAQIASALVATLGFIIIIYQISDARRQTAERYNQAELADARRVYMSYSEATLRYPELTQPDYDALLRNKVEFTRYENFVSLMLYAYDEVLGVLHLMDDSEAEDQWSLALAIDLKPHQRYLCDLPNPNLIATFRTEMQERLDDARLKCEGVKPLAAAR